VIALDVRPVEEPIRALCSAVITGDILEERLLERLQSEYEIHTIYHLAALLSTRAEFTPEAAHRVNVDGTMNLLKLAIEQTRWHGLPVRFMFRAPSPRTDFRPRRKKRAEGSVRPMELPGTMYGINKLYCEHLGRYYAHTTAALRRMSPV